MRFPSGGTNIYPVLIDLGQLRIGGVTIPLAIGGYGAVFVLSIILGWAVVVTLGQRVGPRSVFSDTYITAIIAGVIGAKLTNGLVFLPDILSGRKPLAIMLMGGGVWPSSSSTGRCGNMGSTPVSERISFLSPSRLPTVSDGSPAFSEAAAMERRVIFPGPSRTTIPGRSSSMEPP